MGWKILRRYRSPPLRGAAFCRVAQEVRRLRHRTALRDRIPVLSCVTRLQATYTVQGRCKRFQALSTDDRKLC
eukprot:7226588-Alexandrium_andersonii.AAC.1